jgi:hypothetical protein
MTLTGENQRTRRYSCPSVTFSTTKTTWTDPSANPGLRGERPATNRLSHNTANLIHILSRHFHMIHFNIILPSMPRASECSLSHQDFQPKFCKHFSFTSCGLYVPPTSSSLI